MFITQVQNTRLLVNMQGLTYLFCEKILKNPSKTVQNHQRVSEESCRHLRITPRYFARFLQIVDNGRKCPLLSLLKTTKADKELGFSFIQKIASCPCSIQYWSKEAKMYFWVVTGSVVGKGDDGKKLFYYELKIIIYYELPHSKEEWESQFLLG